MSYEVVVNSREGWINIANAKFKTITKANEYLELIFNELQNDIPTFSRDSLYVVKSEVMSDE
jgi:hypothetical protein